MTRTMGFMRGLPGRGIAAAAFSTGAGITLTFTDGSTWSSGPLGTGGGAGADGRGIDVAAYNQVTGILTLTFTDGTTFATGDLRWAAGAQGPAGVQGPVGAAGTSSVVIGFTTDAAAIAHSAANPGDLVYSTEGV